MFTLSQSMPRIPINKAKPHGSGTNDHPERESSSASIGHRNQLMNVHSKRLNKPRFEWAALIDRGANGSIAGRDMRVIERTSKTIDLSGIDDHTVRNLTIVTAGGVVRTSLGEIILVIHQAADMTGESKTILSAGQLEGFGNVVYDQPMSVTKTIPHISLLEGHKIPIAFRKGLPYIQLRPFTDRDWESLPHVIATSPIDWDPATLDSDVPESWFDAQSNESDLIKQSILSEDGRLKDDLDDNEEEYFDAEQHYAVDRKGIMAHLTSLVADDITRDYILCEYNGETIVIEEHNNVPPEILCHPVQTRSQRRNTTSPPVEEAEHTTGAKSGIRTCNNKARSIGQPKLLKPSKRDFSKYACFFPGANLDSIRRTFDATTQLGTRGAVSGVNLRNRLLSPNPILNIHRRNEDVATDTLYSRTPAIDNGSTAAQFFVGRKSLYRSVTPCGSSDKDFARTLMDEIRKYGAMDRLISDNARAQISEQVKDILRTFCIKDWQSEPHIGNQNYAERAWKDTKTRTNNLLNTSGAPPELWLQALQYVCVIQNHTSFKSLNDRTPIEWLLGYTPDISVLLHFRFWEPVYYAKYDAKFPSDSTEELGRFVGIAENVGNAMTFKILTKESKIIHRSVVRSATKETPFTNKRADADAKGTPVAKQHIRTYVESKMDHKIEAGGNLPSINPTPLLGRTFINDPSDDGTQIRAKIEAIEDVQGTTADCLQPLFKFRSKVGDETFEHVMTYHKMLEWCDRDLDKDNYFHIDGILGHRKNHESGRGHQVLIQWGDGTSTWNDLGTTFQDDPITVSLYAQKNGLLDTPGWKDCKRYVKNEKKLARMINQARLKVNRTKPVYKYGYQIPRNHNEAVKIDKKYGNTKWQDAEKLEIKQLFEYEAFEDLGKDAPVPKGYTQIPCHFVYDVKHDGRHKARMVAGGHRTSTPTDSVYSGVVSLAGIRAVTFLAELNDLELWGTDIGNAYLESYTKEKVAFIAGPEFGDLQGHTMIIVKALYGLRTSGARWHDRLFDALTIMGFRPSRADPDIWMRQKDGHYEYIAVYVDDLLIASKEPSVIIVALEAHPNLFKLKGTGPIKFHLGCDFFRDDTGTLCMGPKTYIERMCAQYESMFGVKPKAVYTSPLTSNDHPELDTSDLLDEDGAHQYQSILGVLQWTISLGRFDIATAVMTMSGFRTAPRVGHMDRLRRICGYLSKMKHGFIRVRTGTPDYSDMNYTRYDWERTVYGKIKEEFPTDAPVPLGKPIILTSYVDANLHHDMITGRSVTAVLHFANQTPIDWFSKKQSTVEMATYGSEFVAAKMAVQQVMGIRMFFRYLGVAINGPTHLFGDNGSVVTSGSLPHSPLRKRHHALSYHYTREAIASGAVDFQFLPGHLNPADILSKHWGYQQVWASALRPILFWKGDTANLLLEGEAAMKKKETSSKNYDDKTVDATDHEEQLHTVQRGAPKHDGTQHMEGSDKFPCDMSHQ